MAGKGALITLGRWDGAPLYLRYKAVSSVVHAWFSANRPGIVVQDGHVAYTLQCPHYALEYYNKYMVWLVVTEELPLSEPSIMRALLCVLMFRPFETVDEEVRLPWVGPDERQKTVGKLGSNVGLANGL
jgi:hypothetical protein